MSNSTTDRVRGELLREWRESQKLDASTLAGRANLSVAQIQQLESGGTSLFYTASIKENAARKVASLLGRDPAEVIRQAEDLASEPGSSVVDELIELSLQKAQAARPASVFMRHSRLMVFALLTLGLLAVIVWTQYPWQGRGVMPSFWHRAVAMSPESSAAAAPLIQTPVQPVARAVAMGSSAKSSASVAESAAARPVVAAASEPVASATGHVAAVGESSLCQPSQTDAVLMPSQPSKPGDMVYLVAQREGTVCVVDGAGSRTVFFLKANEAKSVYGPAPWRVHFEQAEQAQLFFQGVRLRLPDAKTTAVVLREGSRTP
jgi:cytoskeleton protein RodZ